MPFCVENKIKYPLCLYSTFNVIYKAWIHSFLGDDAMLIISLNNNIKINSPGITFTPLLASPPFCIYVYISIVVSLDHIIMSTVYKIFTWFAQ